MVRKFNVLAFTTCDLGTERIGPITVISNSCANPFASDPRSFIGAAISVVEACCLFCLAVYRHFEKPAPKIPMSMSTCENT
ncbi:hypothetical protein EVAR_57005_1 [Eumeta japonica]|uniref:Uncharacterized protein n=1 Tax=Eumeta variegata TaxID=151549 RepID=A0A4C1ZRZ2_EUMVA|nr:hypothetical protein EVAR_57005_1 [Eumeta japonica]